MDDTATLSGSLLSEYSPAQNEWIATPTDASCQVCAAEPQAVASAVEDIADAAPTASDEPATAPQPPAAQEPTPERIIEALLFASDAPLNAARLAELAGLKTGEIDGCVARLNERYESAGLTFRIMPIARGYQMLTLPIFQPWLARLQQQHGESRLSAAALETLSIVAYKQPVIRADVEAIRGVACGEVLNRLREMGLVKAVGRAEIVGRPMLYGTTKKFLDLFGLSDLADLPPLEALRVRTSITGEGAEQPISSLADATAA